MSILKWFFNMQTEELKEVKQEVQKILDNHLKEDQRFSIEDLDEDSVFLLIDLLLEKDDSKRKNIWTEIENKMKTTQMNFEIDYEKIMKIKENLSSLKTNFSDLGDLKNDINSESELDNQLNNI